jgi:LysM domain
MRTTLFTLLLACALVAAACGDDDAGEPALSPTAAPTGGTATPASTPAAATATQTPASNAIATLLAQTPQFLLYLVRAGDTLTSVATAFSGAPGVPVSTFAATIKDRNQLKSDQLSRGQLLAIPLVLTGDLSMMPEASLEAAIGAGGAGGKLVLLQPSLEMRSDYLGRLVLHAVEVADGNPASEGFGYRMEYWLADRPPIKGGEVDQDAHLAQAAFVVVGGSLVPGFDPSTVGVAKRFSRDGVEYVVAVFPRSTRTAEQIAAKLQTARER